MRVGGQRGEKVSTDSCLHSQALQEEPVVSINKDSRAECETEWFSNCQDKKKTCYLKSQHEVSSRTIYFSSTSLSPTLTL